MIEINNDYKILNERYRGRKPKYGLEKDGKKYIFKYGALNNEIYAELIAEQLGIQMGIDMAHYMIANHNGITGILTENFIRSGEMIISSDRLREIANEILIENNMECDINDNSITSIVESAWTYDSRVKTDELTDELLKRWIFAGVILESDKNDTNISFIKSIDGLRLSPDYDNSSMCQLNKNISLMIEDLRHGLDVYSITDFIGNKLHLSKLTKHMNFLDEFREFCIKYPYHCSNNMHLLNNLDIDSAISIVEKINDINIPYQIQFWIRKLIESRLNDMKLIQEQTNNYKIKKLHR